MKGSSPPVSLKDAIKFADELETALSEIANGKRKPQNISREPMIALIQFARDTVRNLNEPGTQYAVIGFYEDNNQIFCHHVTADSAMNAFAQIAASSADGMQGEPVFVAALPVADTGRLEYPGEGLVYAETVLEQGDVFPLHQEPEGSVSFRP